MGCDIHLFAEHRHPNSESWWGFGGRMNPGRDYGLFGTLAGVREDGPPVSEPRGFPVNAGWAAREEYTIYVTETPEEAAEWRGDLERAYPREKVESWVPCGSSVWLEGPHPVRNGLVGKISDPDAHTATWLTLPEFRDAIRRREMKYPSHPVGAEYRALLAALESLAADGHEARVVFWFDN
jgi:hypothetical protein